MWQRAVTDSLANTVKYCLRPLESVYKVQGPVLNRMNKIKAYATKAKQGAALQHRCDSLSDYLSHPIPLLGLWCRI